MELVYLWVEDYKNIKNQGFNFSPRFDCKYDKDANKLTIDENKNYISIFPDNINITAIVGENGSGKSTLLELTSIIKLELQIEFLEKKKILLLFEKDDTFYPIIGFGLMHDFKYLNSKLIKNKTTKNITSSETNTNDLFILSYFNSGLPDFTDQNNKYEVLKSSKYDQYYNGFYVNYTNPKETIKYIEQYNKYTECMKLDSNIFNFLDKSFFFNLFKLEINFKDHHSFELRDENLKKEFNKLNIFSMFNPVSLGEYIDKIDDNGRYVESYKKDLKNLNYYEYLAGYFLKGILDMYENIFNYQNRELSLKYLSSFIKKLNILFGENTVLKGYKNNISLKIVKYKALLNLCINELKAFNKEINNTELKGSLKYLKEEFNNLYYSKLKYLVHYNLLFKIYWENFHFLDDNNYKTDSFLVTSKNIKEAEKKLIKNKLIDRLYQDDVIRFYYYNKDTKKDYSSLSTGEKQIINFFINLSYTILISHSDDLKHFVLMLDEIELSLHPNWQKKILNYLQSLLNNMKQDMNTHILITSHSPFIVSDLGKDNIVFLEDGKQVYPFENKQTFGANIHTLLSDGFFMQDGLMGEFAKGKIEEIKKFYELVKRFEEEDFSSPNSKSNLKHIFLEQKTKFRHIQSIIGEPFLQTVIKNYLDELEVIFNGKKQFLQDEIKRLQELESSL